MATATRIYIVSPRQHDLAAGPVPRRLVRAVHWLLHNARSEPDPTAPPN